MADVGVEVRIKDLLVNEFVKSECMASYPRASSLTT